MRSEDGKLPGDPTPIDQQKLPPSRGVALFTREIPVVAILAVLVLLFALPARASFFSALVKFFKGDDEIGIVSPAAASIALPLLGSQAPAAHTGVGGPGDDSSLTLLVSQDNALVAPRNPLGTLPSSHQDQIVVYTVQPGDTPSQIASNFGITLNTLLWANNILNPDRIRIGDDLIILPVSGVHYEIKKGDTIESIAKQFKGDAADILQFNGLVVNEPLEIGATIIIPDGEITPPPSSGPRIVRGLGAFPEFQGYYLRPLIGGRRSRGLHGFNGIDLADTCGRPVLASAEGIVLIVRPSGWNGGYGRYIVISHPNGTQTLYAHLSSVLAKVGQSLAQGSQIAAIGSTGNSTGCHLHFEVRGARNPF